MVRHAGRLLAPIAIVAVAIGAYVIVESNVGHHHRSRNHATAAPERSRHDPAATATPSRRASAPRFYTVRSGDTMSDIAHRVGVPLARLEALNASLAPTFSLHVGQRLRLRR